MTASVQLKIKAGRGSQGAGRQDELTASRKVTLTLTLSQGSLQAVFS
jgi:hypothetical protein